MKCCKILNISLDRSAKFVLIMSVFRSLFRVFVKDAITHDHPQIKSRCGRIIELGKLILRTSMITQKSCIDKNRFPMNIDFSDLQTPTITHDHPYLLTVNRTNRVKHILKILDLYIVA